MKISQCISFTSLAKNKAENAIKMDQQLAEMRAGLAG